MILYIDATNLNEVNFALISPTGIKRERHTIAYNEHHSTLPRLEQFLKKHRALNAKRIPNGLKGIVVCSGPGSFTGTRVGVTIAEALGFAWGLPVRAVPSSQIPKNLRDLLTLKRGRKIVIEYNRPAY